MPWKESSVMDERIRFVIRRLVFVSLRWTGSGAAAWPGQGWRPMPVASLVQRSPFRFSRFEAVPIARLRPPHNWITRGFTSAMIRCTP